MKRWLSASLVLFGVSFLLIACNSSESTVRKTVEDLAQTVETGLNRHDLRAAEPFFATAAEGANPDGLRATWEALQQFDAGLGGGDQVQFHSFQVQSAVVHEDARLARVTYRLHFSVIRGGQVIYGAEVVQDLALLKTPRGWRISGGDQPQLSSVIGQLSTRR
ncbi:MAG: nuclear transport factor 2 family protein [Chloroflexi bacterium]|nr:nuclear transport factor 2 family protein [Chloroflexota bacterium]